MDERTKKYRRHLVEARHAASQDYDRAILTLASATLALSVTFLHDIAPVPKAATSGFVVASWICLVGALLAILGSLLTSQWALGQAIEDVDGGREDRLEHPGGWPARITQALNIAAGVSFVAGLCLLAWFANQNI